MSGSAILHLIPYIISLVISATVGIYAWNRREVAGALSFALVAWAEASWTIGYIFELHADSLQAKLFWDNTQFFGTSAAPLFLLAFALDYTGHRLTYRRVIWASLFTLVVLSMAIVFAFGQHSWVRPTAWIVDEQPFSALLYDFGLMIWLYSGYNYAIILAAFLPLISQLIYAQRVYRVQIALILGGVTIPLIGTFLTMLDVTFSTHRDMSPITFAIGNLIIAWGLFRYRLFDLVPVARNLVVDSMNDQVFVLDAHGRLIDLNEAAQRATWSKAETAIGVPAAEFFSDWPDLVEHFSDMAQAHSEVMIDVAGKPRYLDIRLSSLYDRLGNLSGRVIVVRDITKRKLVEQELIHYRAHLEEVVEQRTAELLTAREALTGERQRIAAELHDSVTQTIFAANTIVELLPRMQARNADKAEQYMIELRQLTRGAMAELRALMIELRPTVLAQTELGVLIKHLCDVFTGNTRVEVAFHVPQKLFLPEPLQIVFYRVAQEALNIIARHARATEVNVHLLQQNNQVELCITYNGTGFDPLTISPGQTGIESMQGYAKECGAILTITSQDGGGTTVKLSGVINDD